MMNAWIDPLVSAMMGDKVVLFYSGHGVVEGLKDVNGEIFTLDRFGALRETALDKWIELTIILESCHSGSVADYFRRQEILSLRENLYLLPDSEAAAELLDMADNMQRMKNEISALEARKQACLNLTEEQSRDTAIVNRALQRAESLNPQIQAKWEEALIQLAEYQTRVHQLTSVTLSLPVFEEGHWENFWTNQAQLDVLSNMINQTINLARGSG